MKNLFKRLLALTLVLVMALSMLPAVGAQAAESSTVLTDADYASADTLFAQIEAMEESPAKKSASQTQLTEAAIALVKASDSYVNGSLERSGNAFTWMTKEGIRCSYSPRLREIAKNMQAPENPEAAGCYNEPVLTKGGWPGGKEVYLVGPYYGVDSSFTNQYKNEAASIASAIGDTSGYTLYSGSAATVDKVAEAVSNGAVVIFDSHGDTFYTNPKDEYDYVVGATSSYLCLYTRSGFTTQDYTDGAVYESYDGIVYAGVNGQVISNHMTKDSPSGLLWMAICLGMATDGLYAPLRERGVEVVYGYSQSVSFDGDYCYEEVFWDNMCAGKTVAESVAAMKQQYGEWDGSPEIGAECGWSYNEICYDISEARTYYYAFPIVVSDEDSHPGQRTAYSYGADSLQTVRSTYTLFPQFNVTAQSNNTAYGTVTVSGSTITAVPKTGYYAQSATVLSGTATVTQNGNTFSVQASSDCTIRINFAPKTAVTVSFSGANIAAQSGYAGDDMQLPTPEAPEGFTFLGWMENPLSQDTTEKPDSFMHFIPTNSVTLYALYSYVDESTSSGSGDYVKVTENQSDWSGEYLIVYEDGNCIFDGSLTMLDAVNNYQSVNIKSNTISASEADDYRFIVEPYDGGYSIQAISGMYIGNSSNSNALQTSSQPLRNSIQFAAGEPLILSAGSSRLRFNANDGQNRFRYYKSTSYLSQMAVALYRKDGSAGITYYTSTPYTCEHEDTSSVPAVNPGCVTAGYTAGVYCNDCENFISGRQVVDALGHSWGSWTQTLAPTCIGNGSQSHTCTRCGETETQSLQPIGHTYDTLVTPPTVTNQGYTTYTCQNCGDSYVGNYVDALGYTYTVHFSIPGGVSQVADMTCGKNGITLPSAGAPTGEQNYKFVGWTTSRVEDTTGAVSFYTAGQTFKTDSDVTLYALYSYVAGATGSGNYELVTSASQLQAGAKVVIASNQKGYVAGNINSQYLSNKSATFSSDKKTITKLPSDALILTLGGSSGAWTLENSSGQKLGATTVKKLAWNSGTTNWSISISSNNATIQNGTSTYGRFLYNVSSPRFTTYTSNTSSTMLLPQLYMLSGSVGTTYYTTQVPCNHASVYVDNQDGTHSLVCLYCDLAQLTNQAHIYADGLCFCGAAEPAPERLNVLGIKTASTLILDGVIYVRATVGFVDANDRTKDFGLTKEQVEADASILFWSEKNMPANWDDAILGTENERSAVTFSEEYDGINEYRALSHGIATKEYNDKVYFRTYIVIDGQEYYGEIAEYSVVTYAENQLGKTGTAYNKVKPLLAAMLNYGAAAQTQFKYKTDSLANANLQSFVDSGKLEAKYLNPEFQYSMLDVPANPSAAMTANFVQNGAAKTAGTLLLEGAIGVRTTFAYNLANGKGTQLPAGAEATVYYWTAKDYAALETKGEALSKTNASYTRTREDMTQTYSGTYGYEYQVISEDVVAKALGEAIYMVCVFTVDGVDYVSDVVVYSPEVYAKNQIDKTGAAASLKELCQRMVIYGEAAKAYFG